MQITISDEDKSHDTRDSNESKENDTKNQLLHDQNITKTDFPVYTVIVFHCFITKFLYTK